MFSPILGHNIRFDRHMLMSAGFDMSGCKFHDTQLMSYLLNPERQCGHGLKALALAELGESQVIKLEDLTGKGKKRVGVEIVDKEKLKEYAMQDVRLTRKLYDYFNPKLTGKLRKLYEDVEIPLQDVLMKMERAGLKIDVKRLDRAIASVGEAISRIKAELEPVKPINWNSSIQVAEYLFEELMLPVVKRSKITRNPSADSEALILLGGTHPVVDKLSQYRKLMKVMGTYLLPYKEQINEDCMVNPNFNQCVTATGRLSSSNPLNFQNIPVKLRSLFIPDNESMLFCEADYSQQEIRILTHFSQDPALMAACTNGEDVYMEVVKQLFGTYDKGRRSLGKLLQLALSYGAQWRKLQRSSFIDHGVRLSDDDAQDLIQRSEKTYKGFFDWKNRVIQLTKDRGYVETLLGRRRYIPQLKSNNRWERMEGERLTVNTIGQGSGADITKLAMLALDKRGVDLRIQVHDSLLWQIHKSDLTDYRPIMENVIKLSVPLKVDIKTGLNWGFK